MTLPWPDTWHRHRARRPLRIAFLVIAPLTLAAAAASGDLLDAVSWFFFGVTLWLLAANMPAPDGQPSYDRTRRALVLPLNRRRRLTEAAVCVTIPLTLLGMSVPRAIGLLVVTPLFVRLTLRLIPRRIALYVTAHDVTYATRDNEYRVAWDEVTEVAATSQRSAVTKRSKRWTDYVVLRTATDDEFPRLGVEADAFAVDPVAAYWALRFYLEHPEARSELGGDRAVARFRQSAFQ